MDPLKVAIIGLRSTGEQWLGTISADDRYSVVAAADNDAELVRRRTDGTDIHGYTDYRSLILETSQAGLDALFVSVPPHESFEYVRLAAQRGIAVFHESPVARSVSEARRLDEAFRANSQPLVVSRPWLFEPAMGPARQPHNAIDRVYAVTVSVRVAETSAGWRGDLTRAGGGVLLHGAYEYLDLLVHLMGLPESVIAHRIVTGAAGTARNYDTEDIVQLLLAFSEDRSAVLTASRGAVEPGSRVQMLGRRGSIELLDDRLIIRSSDSETRDRPLPTSPCWESAIGAFGAALGSHNGEMLSTVSAHLPTLATIEAAYLSSKTGAAESPARVLARG